MNESRSPPRLSTDAIFRDKSGPTMGNLMSTNSGFTLERMEQYRQGAMQASELASPCEDADLRDAYLAIADTWAGLADKIERQLSKQGTRRR